MRQAVGLLVMFLLCLSVGHANPIQVGPFTGTYNFNFLSFPNGTLISNRLQASNGVTFSSALGGVYATDVYSGSTGVAISAVNFNGSCPCDDVTLTFSSPVSEVGFIGWGQNAGSVTFTDPNGSLTINGLPGFPTITPFLCIGDAAGISSLTISGVGINDAFLFSGFTDNSAVPESSSLLLLGTGFAGILGAIRRKLKA
jgi:hypothetical protein